MLSFQGVVKLQTSLNLHLNSDTKKQRGLEGEVRCRVAPPGPGGAGKEAPARAAVLLRRDHQTGGPAGGLQERVTPFQSEAVDHKYPNLFVNKNVFFL